MCNHLICNERTAPLLRASWFHEIADFSVTILFNMCIYFNFMLQIILSHFILEVWNNLNINWNLSGFTFVICRWYLVIFTPNIWPQQPINSNKCYLLQQDTQDWWVCSFVQQKTTQNVKLWKRVFCCTKKYFSSKKTFNL